MRLQRFRRAARQQLGPEGVLDVNGPATKKPKSVYITIARYVTGEKACYDPEDIQYRIFEHAREYMYKSLQHYIPGNVKDPTDLHKWKLYSEYLGDESRMMGLLLLSCVNVHSSFSAIAQLDSKVTEGPDYFLIVRCCIHNSEAPHDGNIFLKISCMCDLILPFC